jgi:hypothetical protein
MKTLHRLFLLLGFLIGVYSMGYSQCKTFTKNDCKPRLDPYIYNGQQNSAVLNEGDIAELMLTFYSNQDYRIVICAAPELGKVVFRLLDEEGKELFTNKDHNYTETWDFKTKSTQQLVVEVSVPEAIAGEMIKSGCVSILVGFLDKQ